jgi:hypothetical protein
LREIRANHGNVTLMNFVVNMIERRQYGDLAKDLDMVDKATRCMHLVLN